MRKLLEKNQEHWEQMAQMINMMAMIVKDKGIVVNPSSQKGLAFQNSKKDPLYSPRFVPPHAYAS